MHNSGFLLNSSSMHSGKKYCLFQLFFNVFDMFVEQKKEIMYCKWNTACTGRPDFDLFPACSILSNLLLFLFTSLCVCTNHNNLNLLLIN